jgi:tetratricopeptide (TPR) repeat protein
MGEVWRSVADLQQGAGDLKAALQSYSEAIAAAASTADVRGRAMAELGAGEVASLLGDDASAARSFDRAAPLFNQLTDHRRALTAWQRSFSAWMNLRHVNDANSRFRQAANVQGGALVSKEWKGEALVAMADQLLREARYSEALAIYMEAEVVYADGPPDRLAAVLRSLGDVQVELSRPDNAKVNYKKALEIYRSSADDLGQATVLERLGMLASSVE